MCIRDRVRTILALTLARAAAIVYGQVLSNDEMSNLVDSLFACSTPSYTPDGDVYKRQLKPHIPEESLTAGMARLDSIADDIRNGKFSFEEEASVLSQDKDTRNNHGLLPNPNTCLLYTSLSVWVLTNRMCVM